MEQFSTWLKLNQLEKHQEILIENDLNTLELIAELSEEDLKELGFSMGDRKRFFIAIKSITSSVNISTISLEDQQLIASLPYVIAYPLKRTLEEKHASTKINLFKDTFLNYLKYLGLLTASEFFNSELKNRRMVDAFQKNLAQPSFGSWNAFTRECIAFLKEQNHTFFLPELVAYYEMIETGKKRKIYKREIKYTDSCGDAKLKKQEFTAIGLLINFRNRYIGHHLTLDEKASQQLWDDYFPVFKLLLEQMSFVKEYLMLKREHGETYLLQGAELKEIKSAHCLDGSIWIENQQGEAFEILPFYIVPGALAIAKEDKEQILSYESFLGKTINFFSPEGSEKQTSGPVLEKLKLLLHAKQKETSFSTETFTKELFLQRIEEENKLVFDTLITQEKKVIEGIYQHRETIEIKLREWIGARANMFFIAAQAGSGKTNLLVEIQKQYTERQLPCLFIRAARMEKSSLKEQIAYQLNLDSTIDLKEYKNIAGTQEEPTFILIDGLNEASNAETIWSEILEISTLFQSGSVKFVITNRANSNAELERYALLDEQEEFIYGERKEHDKEKGLANSAFWLTPMDMKEMEGAWDAYVKKDKARFKPLFSFHDLAKFDRGLYLQINNPLVLRIFLETYQGKKLPNKGRKHLHIWKDWFSTFSEQEQQFMRAFVDAIWEKGENEIELEDVLNNESLREFILTDNISGPYNRFLNLGWVSRFHKDLTLYVSCTVEGLLLFLLGDKLDKQESQITLGDINELLINGTNLQKQAVEYFLTEQVLCGKIDLIANLIDNDVKYIKYYIKPLGIAIRIFGAKYIFDFFKNTITKNDYFVFKEILVFFKINDELVILKECLKIIFQIFYDDNQNSNLDYIPVNYFNEMDSEDQSLIIQKLQNYKDLNLDSWIFISNYFYHILQDYSSSRSVLFDLLNTIEQYEVNDQFKLVRQICFINQKIFLESKKKEIKYSEHSLKLLRDLIKNEKINDTMKSLIFEDLGYLYSLNKNFDNAIHYYDRAMEIRTRLYGNQHSLIADLLNKYAYIDKEEKRIENAINKYKKSLDIRLRCFGENHLFTSTNYYHLAYLLSLSQDLNTALIFCDKCINIRENKFDIKNVELLKTYNLKGDILLKMLLFDKAIVYYKLIEESNININLYFKIAQCYDALNDKENALVYYIQSANLRRERIGMDKESTQEAISNAIRLAKELAKENDLPGWMKNSN